MMISSKPSKASSSSSSFVSSQASSKSDSLILQHKGRSSKPWPEGSTWMCKQLQGDAEAMQAMLVAECR